MAKRRSSEAGAQPSPSKKTNDGSSATAAIMLANGFLAVPVTIPHSKLGKDVKHWIYVRKHTAAAASTSKSGADDLPAERTLFVANLPVDTTESHIREIFAKAGNVGTVKFRRGRTVTEQDDEEDEREERAEGEVSSDEDDDADEAGQEEHHLLGSAQGKAGKRGKKAAPKSRVPHIVPLPSLDPREAMGSQAFLSTSSSAHIVFLDSTSLTRALTLVQQGIKWIDPFRALRKEAEKQQQQQSQLDASSTSDAPRKPSHATTSASFLLSAGAGIPPLGLDFLLTQYTLARPALPDVQSWANSRIALYQYRKRHPLPRRIGVRGVTVGPSGELLDEDGFTIVQRSGKYGRAGGAADAGGSVGVAKHGFEENKNKKSTDLQDFYRFQLREKKRQQLADLRAAFEADKEKVAKLKAGRRFKPY